MNVGFGDDELEFTAVDAEPNKQSNDPPPEFTGTKPSEFKSYRKKVKVWLSVHSNFSPVVRATCFKQVDRPSLGCRRRTGTRGCGHCRWSERDPGYIGGSFPRVNVRRNCSIPWVTLSVGLAGRRVRGSMTVHFGYKATYESWLSKEYGCQTKYRDFFCCVV